MTHMLLLIYFSMRSMNGNSKNSENLKNFYSSAPDLELWSHLCQLMQDCDHLPEFI